NLGLPLLAAMAATLNHELSLCGVITARRRGGTSSGRGEGKRSNQQDETLQRTLLLQRHPRARTTPTGEIWTSNWEGASNWNAITEIDVIACSKPLACLR